MASMRNEIFLQKFMGANKHEMWLLFYLSIEKMKKDKPIF